MYRITSILSYLREVMAQAGGSKDFPWADEVITAPKMPESATEFTYLAKFALSIMESRKVMAFLLVHPVPRHVL